METGVIGVPGVLVQKLVVQELGPGQGDVTIQLLHMVERVVVVLETIGLIVKLRNVSSLLNVLLLRQVVAAHVSAKSFDLIQEGFCFTTRILLYYLHVRPFIFLKVTSY